MTSQVRSSSIIVLTHLGSIQKDFRSSHGSISRKSIQSSFSKTLKKKKSYKLDDLLQNESLISRKNENKVVKSVRKTPMTNMAQSKLIDIIILFSFPGQILQETKLTLIEM